MYGNPVIAAVATPPARTARRLARVARLSFAFSTMCSFLLLRVVARLNGVAPLVTSAPRTEVRWRFPKFRAAHALVKIASVLGRLSSRPTTNAADLDVAPGMIVQM